MGWVRGCVCEFVNRLSMLLFTVIKDKQMQAFFGASATSNNHCRAHFICNYYYHFLLLNVKQNVVKEDTFLKKKPKKQLKKILDQKVRNMSTNIHTCVYLHVIIS